MGMMVSTRICPSLSFWLQTALQIYNFQQNIALEVQHLAMAKHNKKTTRMSEATITKTRQNYVLTIMPTAAEWS